MITLCGQILVSTTDDDLPPPPRRVSTQKRARVYVENVPVCTSTTRTCVTTCGRGAGTHGDVLNLHMEVFGTDTRRRMEEKRERGGGLTVSSANHETAHVELSRALERFTERNPWFLPIQGLRKGREQHVPESYNHSLYLMKLLSSIFILRDTAEGTSTHNTHKRTNTHSPTHPPTDPPTTTPLPSPSHVQPTLCV